MLTKQDFQDVIKNSLANHPELDARYRVNDPRMVQSLEAMATMLGMISQHIDVAVAEPFLKTRDATVLSDAAMRGLVPKATPARARIAVKNNGTADYTMDTSRPVLDSTGRLWLTQTTATVRPGEVGTVEVIQRRSVSITHTVTNYEPFYSIEIPKAVDDAFLSSLSVRDALGEWTWRERYVNTWPGERVYHVEADDRKRVYIRFGIADVVGVQPMVGDTFTLNISYSFGDFPNGAAPGVDTPFAFEYIAQPAENAVELRMQVMLEPGSSPMDIITLRDLARYPSVYEHNAVFLGEFDFLVRRHFPELRFLSVWNESREEAVRGASVDNINVLFVACLSSDGTEAVLTQDDPLVTLHPNVIDPVNLTGTQQSIKAKILEADDSYRVRFMTPVRSEIACQINARVSSAYVASSVRDKIINLVLSEYGEEASASRRGDNRPLYRRIYALIRERIPEMNDANADLTVTIDEPIAMRPELWRYISPETLTVDVVTEHTAVDAWGIHA